MQMHSLSGSYKHIEIEQKWQEEWLKKAVYRWDEDSVQNFVIDTPPPTISGMLHMGHIFSYCHADFIARYQRMRGKNVFFPIGFDNNGLPTERFVEKTSNVRAADLGRKAFADLCKNVSQDARQNFRDLFIKVGLSIDWQQEYHTMSDHARRISQASFVNLYKNSRIYSKLQPTYWDPIDKTAISQAEIQEREYAAKMNYIKFRLLDNSEAIIIATTRPELLPACVAVFYHPEDARYKHLQGKTAVVPIFGLKVPILADENVKPDKGSGLVMCCTFGDDLDIYWWRRHDLPNRIIIGADGHIIKVQKFRLKSSSLVELYKNSDVVYFPGFDDLDLPTSNTHNGCLISKQDCLDLNDFYDVMLRFAGLSVQDARKQMISVLEYHDLLERQVEIVHFVKCAERSGAQLEFLVMRQWYVKLLDMKDQLKARAAECNWHPEQMYLRLEQWIDGLNWDWCISRQRYFGVQIPAWRVDGEVIVAREEDLPIDPLVDLPSGYTKIRDEGWSVLAKDNETGREVAIVPIRDVLDTWFTSSLTPQINAHGVTEDSERYRRLFPADLRPQAHEIIRTWTFYTILKSHLHEGSIPWKNIMISGWCLAPDKTKMSKSKGNAITPMELIREKGVDVIRYWASTARLGADIAYSEDVMHVGKRLVNKLWNAARFVAVHSERFSGEGIANDIKNRVINQQIDFWILAKLKAVIIKMNHYLDHFEYSLARALVEGFFWHDFCDNYLEIVKTRAYGSGRFGVSPSRSAVATLYYCLEIMLKLFAPFLSYITEEIYSRLFASDSSIHACGSWPDAEEIPDNARAKACGDACVQTLDMVRKFKSDRQLSIKHPIKRIVLAPKADLSFDIKAVFADLAAVCNAGAVLVADIEGSYIENEHYMVRIEVE
ncbi:valine--tRNA ligase [Rickettsiales bacterium]|nr:valine--tRNA ligase [Rickettsiales bacterium]